MSNRNNRRAAPASAGKGTKGRRASTTSTATFDLSSTDNDNYSGVDDISDDEDDEEDVFAVEEEALREDLTPSPASTPRPLISDDDDDDDDDDEEDEDDEQDDNSSEVHQKDHEGSSPAAQAISDGEASWAGFDDSEPADVPTSDFFEEQDQSNTRRVRFNVPWEEDEASDSESTEDDHADMYPDIFVDQASLDPSFRRQIEHEDDDSSASDSFWDFNDPRMHSMFENGNADMDSVQSSPTRMDPLDSMFQIQHVKSEHPVEEDIEKLRGLDGYETDGETTEDEEYPVPPVRRKTKRPSLSEQGDESDTDSDADVPIRHKKNQPRVGRFDLDRLKDKPTAIFDSRGKLIIFTRESRDLDLAPEHFDQNSMNALQWSMNDQMSPFVGNGSNFMYDTFTSSLFSDQTFNQLTPGEYNDMMMLQAAEHNAHSPDGSYSNRDSDAGSDAALDPADFLIDDSDIFEESQAEMDTIGPSSTPMRPTTASSDGEVLSHLNSATVGAFRRNQVNSQLMIRNQVSQDSLDFSGPYNSTAISGIRSDRFDTAGVPLTPLRRHKREISDLGRSPLDPTATKRKASSEAPSNVGHKKQKSISDVGSLHL